MVFNRPNADANKNYLFEAIQISVASTGNFIITSHAFFDAVGYLYENSFDPYNPSMNLLAWDDNSGGKTDFRITSTLASGSKYILVITTSQPSVNGIYMIRVNGRTPATLTPFPVGKLITIIKTVFDKAKSQDERKRIIVPDTKLSI